MSKNRYQDYFNCQLRIEQITRNSLYVLLQGIVLNLGSAEWDSESFFVGLHVRDQEGKFHIWESRSVLANPLVASKGFSSFAFKVPIAYLDERPVEFVLDMVKEGAFWFKDIGVPALQLAIELSQLEFASQEVPTTCDVFAPVFEESKIRGELHVQKDQLEDLSLLMPDGSALVLPSFEVSKKQVVPLYFQSMLANPSETKSLTIKKNGIESQHFYIPNPRVVRELTLDVRGSKVVRGSLLDYRAKLLNHSKQVVVLRSVFDPGLTPVLEVSGPGIDGQTRCRLACSVDVIEPGETAFCQLQQSFHEYPRGRYSAVLKIGDELVGESFDFELQAFSQQHSNARNVLVVAPSLPRSRHESGGLRLARMLSLLSEETDSLSFCCEKLRDEDCEYLEETRAICSNVYTNLFEALFHTENNFSHIVVCFYECAERVLPLLGHYFPFARTIVDSVDVHWRRIERGMDCGYLNLFPQEYQSQKARECAVYRAVDTVLAVTNADAEELKETIPEVEVQVVSNIHEQAASFEQGGKGEAILFVGNFFHRPNVLAAQRAISIVTSLNRSLARPRELFIIGHGMPKALRELSAFEWIHAIDHVEMLDEYYHRARVLLAPIDFGSGIKGKICHAICHGVPVVTSHIGVEGIDLVDGRDVYLADTDDAFVAKLQGVFEGGLDLDSLRRNALQKVLDVTSIALARTAIQELFFGTQCRATMALPSVSAR